MKTGKPILIACEESQTVCIEFRKQGFEAFSCDTEPCSGGKPEYHIQSYLEDIIGNGADWAAIIAFPPCTYLASSGLFRNIGNPEREAKTLYALSFVRMIMERKTWFIAVENPVGRISTAIRKPDQIIQPYEFGHNASKKTCLWLKNLPKLIGTQYVQPRMVGNLKRWDNQTDSGQNKLLPSENRARERSRTYLGIAQAMVEQWGPVIEFC